MADNKAFDVAFMRLVEKGLLDLPSSDGDPYEHFRKIRKEMARMTPQAIMDQFVSDIAAGMIPTMATTFPKLGREGAIKMGLQLNWQINASVTRKPPYRAVVSSNLVFFLSSMTQTLMSGIGITFADEDSNIESEHLDTPSVREVARGIKAILDGFVANQTVPSLDMDARGERYMMQFKLFHCALSSVVGHELGHVVVAESRLSQQPAPFEDFCATALEDHFDQILEDPRFEGALGSLSERQRVEVFDSWLTEINSDILGASLALGFQKDSGLARGVPGIVAFTKFALHLGFLSQMMLVAYMNLFGEGPGFVTKTHPPIDFRMHCVLMWMYRKRFKEATDPVVGYVQAVLTEVLRQAGGDMSQLDGS